jgi:hypothetical protein
MTGCGAAGRVRVIDPDLPRGSADAEYCKDGETSNCNWLEARIEEAKSKGLWASKGNKKPGHSAGHVLCMRL